MKFEYDYLYPVGRIEKLDDTIVSMKHMGTEGWELVSVDNGIAYFKRPLRTKSEAEILSYFDYPIERDRSSEV